MKYLKKSEMRGQFIDMQKTRGGIPPRLETAYFPEKAHFNMLKMNIPHVIGRTGWYRQYGMMHPSDCIFIYYNDRMKAKELLVLCKMLDEIINGTFDRCSSVDEFAFNIQCIQAKYHFKPIHKYKRILKKIENMKLAYSLD